MGTILLLKAERVVFLLSSNSSRGTKSHHRKRDAANLNAAVLDNHCSILNSCLMQPWLQSGRWKASIRNALCQLVDAVSKYATYLKEKNKEVQSNHEKPSSVRVVSDAETYFVIKRAQWVKPTYAAQYRTLQQHIDVSKEFEPIFLNDIAPADARYGWCVCECVCVCVYVSLSLCLSVKACACILKL